ncbi:hypothetical protein PVAP13_1KG367200 [Panicum virgatum]|uniref:Uncharacterized protein n=1 Tax=Panicum virgatum TaxID=38727 RepID=A0A8T0XDF3_PANVG|nr:hypothetical protein PVAP13_1KG367200 [Panicum virgatum]
MGCPQRDDKQRPALRLRLRQPRAAAQARPPPPTRPPGPKAPPTQTAIIKRFPEPLPVSHRKHFAPSRPSTTRAPDLLRFRPRRPHEIPERAAPGGEEESRPGPRRAARGTLEGQDAKRVDTHSHASAAAGRRRGEGSAPGGVRGEGGGADRARHWGRPRGAVLTPAPRPARAVRAARGPSPGRGC